MKTLEGKTIALAVSSSDLVETMKHKIQETEGILPEEQVLIFAGKQVENGLTLLECNIQKNAILYLVQTNQANHPRVAPCQKRAPPPHTLARACTHTHTNTHTHVLDTCWRLGRSTRRVRACRRGTECECKQAVVSAWGPEGGPEGGPEVSMRIASCVSIVCVYVCVERERTGSRFGLVTLACATDFCWSVRFQNSVRIGAVMEQSRCSHRCSKGKFSSAYRIGASSIPPSSAVRCVSSSPIRNPGLSVA